MLNLTVLHLITSSISYSPLLSSPYKQVSFLNGNIKQSFSTIFYQIPSLNLLSSKFENSLDSIVYFSQDQSYENQNFHDQTIQNPLIVVNGGEELKVKKCIFNNINTANQIIKYNNYDGTEKNTEIKECSFSNVKASASIIELICPVTTIESNCFYKCQAESSILHLADDPTKYKINVNFTTIVDHTVRAYSLKAAALNVTINNVNISKGQITAQAIHIEFKGTCHCYLNSVNGCPAVDTLVSAISSRGNIDQGSPELDTNFFFDNVVGSNYMILDGQIIGVSNCVFINNSNDRTLFSCGAAGKVLISNCYFDQPRQDAYNIQYDSCGFDNSELERIQLLFLNTTNCAVYYNGEAKNEIGLPSDYGDNDDNGGLSGGAIAGIVIGCVAVVGVVVAVVVKFTCFAGTSVAAAA